MGVCRCLFCRRFCYCVCMLSLLDESRRFRAPLRLDCPLRSPPSLPPSLSLSVPPFLPPFPLPYLLVPSPSLRLPLSSLSLPLPPSFCGCHHHLFAAIFAVTMYNPGCNSRAPRSQTSRAPRSRISRVRRTSSSSAGLSSNRCLRLPALKMTMTTIRRGMVVAATAFERERNYCILVFDIGRQKTSLIRYQ